MKRICSVLIILCLIITLASCSKDVTDPQSEGITFGLYADEYYPKVKQGDDLYYVNRAFEKMPKTYEAWIYLPESTTEEGVLLGNLTDGSTDYVNLQINKDGVPEYHLSTSGESGFIMAFESVNLFTGKWEHIAFVHDTDSNTIHFYLNGVLAESKDTHVKCPIDTLYTPFTVGGDSQYQNHPPFKGKIKSVSFYSDVRTEKEIERDYKKGADTRDKDVLASYDMSADKIESDIKDETKNGYDLIFSNMWLTELEMELKREQSDFERAYSFAVVGDTQFSTQFYHDSLNAIYNWITDNKQDKNIEYVFGVGDITNRDTIYEWDTAKEAISVMNGVVPYSLVRGNHDLKVYTAEANNSYHEKQTGEALEIGESSKGTAFDRFFAIDTAYTDQFENYGGFYEEGSVMNTWRTFDIENSKWLFINLDYAASDDVLKWANEVVSAHPDRKVIVTTHGYLNRDGEHIKEDVYNGEKETDVLLPGGHSDVNHGVDIWNEFVSLHENITLVLSGHMSSARIVTSQRKGVNGNTVTEMLIDGQQYDNRFGGCGFVAMLYFNKDGTEFEVEYISTANETAGMYYRGINQFKVNLE